MKRGVFLLFTYILISCASPDESSNLDNYNQNMTFLTTGAKPGEEPSFPNRAYDAEIELWNSFLKLKREGSLLSTFNLDGWNECILADSIQDKITGYKKNIENSDADLLSQINQEAAQGDANNEPAKHRTHIYSTPETCDLIAKNKPLTNTRILVHSELVSTNNSEVKKTISTSWLYNGTFDQNFMPLNKSSILMLSVINTNLAETFSPWELTYIVKKSDNDHVKFMEGTPYAEQPMLKLDGVTKSIYSQTLTNDRLEERKFYGSKLVAINRFANNRVHGLQEAFLRNVGYKYSCYENGNKVVIPKSDCEKL